MSQRKWRRRKGVDFTVMDGEAVLVEPKSGRYLSMDPVATRIWEILEETGDPEAVIERMLEDFEVEEARLRGDVHALLEECMQLGLLEEVTS